AVAEARAELAALLGADPGALLFTGCATEANNLALRGAARALSHQGRHLITSAVEHPSVAAPLARLAEEGWEVEPLPVDETGRVRPADLERRLRPNTALVSVMHANNEVGTVQPVAELARLAHGAGARFHTDAAQSVGKLPVEVDALGADLLTVAGHKFGAPKGVGALYVRPGTPLDPLLLGGGQERGLRPGTENVPHIVALGAAARHARTRREADATRTAALRDRLHQRLAERIPGLLLNGHAAERLPGTLHVSFPGVSGAELLTRCAGEVAASTGSACHSGKAGPSGLLGAMGLSPERAAGAVRLSVGHATTRGDVERAAEALVRAHAELT
ncbi:MAG: cysteine desulfurase family protein, partial [Thiohalospira sp.]